uniref:Uncharacterized protein n=1 Tax=Rhizophora mucronata TaxID=61149 RepID=A0A2P2NEV4_RHIMU
MGKAPLCNNKDNEQASQIEVKMQLLHS